MADRGIPRRVTYREVDEGYFDKRGLQRHAGVWSLWALGVAAVISGDFFGWNFGLDFGFGGLLVATIVITLALLASTSGKHPTPSADRSPGAGRTRGRGGRW